jgi:hypothetical protein
VGLLVAMGYGALVTAAADYVLFVVAGSSHPESESG